MNNYKAITEHLTDDQQDLFDELLEYYYEFKTDEENTNAMLLEIVAEDCSVDDHITEMSDNAPNPYHYNRYEWALENWQTVQEHEGEAISLEIDSVSDIIAFAWSQDTLSDCNIMLDAVRSAIDKLNIELN